MANYTFCTHSKCPKSNICKRFLIRESDNPIEIDFRNLCNDKNNYFMRIKMEQQEQAALVKKKDEKEDEKEDVI